MMTLDQKKQLQAAMERWTGFVRDRVVAAERSVGKASLTPDEGVDLWRQLRAEVIRDVELLVRHASTQMQRKPTCASCASGVCCCSRVDVVLMDAVLILEKQEHEGALTKEFLSQCRDRARAELRAGKPSSWIARRTPCLFLRNGRCSVYDVRPVPCALFYVWSDPMNCVDMKNLRELVVPQLRMLHIAYGGLVDRLMGTYDPGFRGTTLPGALWVMGSAWPLRGNRYEFSQAVRRLSRKVMLSAWNTVA
jgi:Fe-S-cluster containining protein